jgi:hypothetical protein
VKGKITKTVSQSTSERSGVTEGLEATNSVVAFLGSSTATRLGRQKVRKTFSLVPLSISLSHDCYINVSASLTRRTFDMPAQPHTSACYEHDSRN